MGRSRLNLWLNSASRKIAGRERQAQTDVRQNGAHYNRLRINCKCLYFFVYIGIQVRIARVTAYQTIKGMAT